MGVKVLRNEKFASEIFAHFPQVSMLHRKRIHGFVRLAAKPKRHQWVQDSLVHPVAGSGRAAEANAGVRNLQDDAGSLTGALNRSGF